MNYKNFVFIFSMLSTPTLAATECIPWQQDDGKNKDLNIGTITIETANIFNLSEPNEASFLHKTANKLHVMTKKAVIQRQLLFVTGDPFNLRKIKESARLLQANKYIQEASIVPIERCGNQVNINVYTRDMWTLTSGISFGLSGGNDKSGIEFQENNLFGLGKSLSLRYKNETERNSTLLSYNDPQLFGSRKRLFIELEDNSDGKGHTFNLDLPFYQFESQQAWGINTSSKNQETSFYDKGIVTRKTKEEKDSHSLFYGWLTGREDDHVSRFKIGWQYTDTQYNLITSTSAPLSLVESYPWFEYNYIQDKHIKKRNFKTMGLLEDISLGVNFSAGIGLLLQPLGSNDNQLKVFGRFTKGYELGTKDLGFFELKTETYLGNGVRQGEQLTIKGEWYSFNKQANDWYLSGQISTQSNLLPSEQLILGGENGLRGYPNAYQTGDKAALITAERRFHFDWYPLHVAKFGAVAFADVGTAWGNKHSTKLLADVGIGLRLIPTRSSSAKSLHFDIALPLSERSEVDDVQFLITTKNSF